jgi:Ca2+-binding EF-hand superfamily protein
VNAVAILFSTRFRMAWTGRLALAMCLLAFPAMAQPRTVDPRDAAMQTLLLQLHPGATLDAFTERLRQEFRQLDADADGVLTAADADMHEAVAIAQVRAMMATQILRADLDHDGVVTADELRRVLAYERRLQNAPAGGQAIESEVRRLMAADKDGDGRISAAEAMGAADLQPENRRTAAAAASGTASRVRQLLTLSKSGDGRLALADFEAAGAEQFRAVDADGNGTIAQEELNTYRQRQVEQTRRNAAAAQEAAERAACAMPKASDAAKVVVLSAYRGEAISRVALGSQDVMTGTGEIRIEPGEGPLYIVVVSHEPTIWRVTGAVERIERLIAAGMTPADSKTALTAARGSLMMTLPNNEKNPVPLMGISGVPADRVSFLTRATCLKSFTEKVTADSVQTVAAVRRDSGKDPDVVAGRYNVGGFVVPSGQIRSAYDDKNQPRLTIVKEYGTLTLKGDTSGVVVQTGPIDVETDLAQSSPGGVVDLDEKAVVANAPVARYDILPGLAGLLQLQNSGALTRNSRGEFIIRRQIRFPAGLSGHSVKFVLLRGVPVPEGNPDGAMVISEETGMEMKLERR